MEQEKMRIMN